MSENLSKLLVLPRKCAETARAANFGEVFAGGSVQLYSR
jgi:hypothetical protein